MNTIRDLWIGFVITLLAAFVGGCAAHSPHGANDLTTTSASHGKFPPYNVIRLYNDSPDEITVVELDAGGLLTTLEKLPAEHSPTSDRGIRPETQTAEVRWQSADGVRQQQTVQIAEKLPPGFHGVIVLKLKPTGDVETEFVRYEDLQ